MHMCRGAKRSSFFDSVPFASPFRFSPPSPSLRLGIFDCASGIFELQGSASLGIFERAPLQMQPFIQKEIALDRGLLSNGFQNQESHPVLILRKRLVRPFPDGILNHQ